MMSNDDVVDKSKFLILKKFQIANMGLLTITGVIHYANLSYETKMTPFDTQIGY